LPESDAHLVTLQQAIERLYMAFATMPRPQKIACKPYEMSVGELRQLLTYPLRELQPGVLRSYLFDAWYTVGTWDDFRFFLPRLLELSTTEDIELQTVSYKVNTAQERGLPLTEAQREALKTFALAFWDQELSGGCYWPVITLKWEILEPFGVKRAELLETWRRHAQGAEVLADYILLNGQVPGEWARAEMIAWLEEAFFIATDPEVASSLSNALLILDDGALAE